MARHSDVPMSTDRNVRLVESELGTDSVTVVVERWLETQELTDIYIRRPRSSRMLWNYVRHVGVRSTLAKVRSRLAERRRNRKIAALGIGYVAPNTGAARFAAYGRLVFFAPVAQPDRNVVVLDVRLVRSLNESPESRQQDRAASLYKLETAFGWSAFSGQALPVERVQGVLANLAGACHAEGRASAAAPSRPPAVSDRTGYSNPDTAPTGARPSCALFGLGNYAKTQILPVARKFFHVSCIHEIDPDQIQFASKLATRLDTAPLPREDENYDVWFVAGYHHHHADIAVTAMERGGTAIVEKPLVTTQAQHDRLLKTLSAQETSSLFTCFQRRYTRFNTWARVDLGLAHADPVSYYCIVYEIPIPARHWYNWPNSGSRIVSNGCHWIDHFMFLNGYPELVRKSVNAADDGTIVIFLEASNGANFSMTLTSSGSERLGVRDYVELRANDATVHIADMARYWSEDSTRVLRRRKINPSVHFRDMYTTIADRAINGRGGDDIVSLASSQVMLDLEELYQDSVEKQQGERAGATL